QLPPPEGGNRIDLGSKACRPHMQKEGIMKTRVTRRTFVKTALLGTVAASVDLRGFPSIVPSSVLGATAPSNRVNIGAIGNGRISRGHDLPGVWRYDEAQVVAVCDLDSKRAEDARVLV